MSTAGSPERVSSFPIGFPVGGAAMAAPVVMIAPVVKYTRADFERENAVFRTVYEGRELTYPILDRYFDWEMYDAADRTVVQCHCNRYHVLAAARGCSVRDTHLAIMILNRFLCDPKNPIERNVAQVYQRIMALAAKPSEKIDEESRAESRRRAINVSLKFYQPSLKVIIKYLYATGQVPDQDTKAAVSKLTHDEACGNFVDAIACELCRMAHAWAKR